MLAITFGNYMFAKSFQKIFCRIRCFGSYLNAISTVSKRWLPTNLSKSSTLILNQLDDGVNTLFATNCCSKVPNFSQKHTPTDSVAQTEAKYRYHKEIEDAINKQIVAEFQAAFSYLGMSCYFGRTNVALLGTQKFYRTMFNEETEHAMIFIKYQEMRGGHVKLDNMEPLHCDECCILKSLKMSLCMEKEITDQLLELYELAKKHEDIRTVDFLTTEFIREQLQSVRNLGELINVAEKLSENGLAEYILDQRLSTGETHSE